ncbi:MAG: menaquinone biosynthesis protein [Syntrophomonadaceae bacterium]|nr:menaquinone biosynthesis protein [Syntrophomonadaceae bacterium]
MVPKVGQIQFINCFPLYYGQIEKKFLLDIELIRGTPTELNGMLKNNQLHLSSISSVAYAQNWEDYVLMPEISISADGEVKSVNLYSKIPIGELDGKTVALTNLSATSQALLKIIMAEHYKIKPNYFETISDLGTMLDKADAALLIGDDALRTFYEPNDNLYVYDLATLWKEFTGLPMVFAVWAIRKEFAENHLDELRLIKQVFTDSISYSLANIKDVARKASKWGSFPTEHLEDYFVTLKYDFNESKQKGLLEYYRQVHKLGLIKDIPDLKVLNI